VSRSATEIALGENLTLLNRYVLGRMLVAVITAGGHTFFACFSFHLGSPRFLRGSHTWCLSCGVLGAQVKPKSEAKASTDDFNVFALPSRLQNAVIRVYDDAGTWSKRTNTWASLKLSRPLIVTVVGKAFFDIGHAPQITQTGEPIFKGTLHGKFIPWWKSRSVSKSRDAPHNRLTWLFGLRQPHLLCQWR
jgi:hypothetical protein